MCEGFGLSCWIEESQVFNSGLTLNPEPCPNQHSSLKVDLCHRGFRAANFWLGRDARGHPRMLIQGLLPSRSTELF